MRIQEFQKFRDVALIQPQRSQVVLPAFTLAASTWAGASVLLAEYNLSNTVWISFKLPIDIFGDYFIPAVRFVDDGVVTRYKLWEDVGEVLYYPVYDGERLGPGAYLEIWSINTTSAPVLSSDYTFETSYLNFPPNQNCSACCQNPSSSSILIAADPTILSPYAYCNPLCLPLTIL